MRVSLTRLANRNISMSWLTRSSAFGLSAIITRMPFTETRLTVTIPHNIAPRPQRPRTEMRLVTRVRGVFFCVGIALVGLMGCGDTVEKLETLRLVEVPPSKIWQSTDWCSDVDVFDWTFQRSEDLEPWVLSGIDQHQIVGDSLSLTWQSGIGNSFRSTGD